jgi:GrpB-like predicted nucleotidyltransferase (UPF0157 family)
MIVKVVKHDPNWAQKYEIESKAIQELIGPIINKLHHIGSTSVPGLMAKPIIDILLDVSDLVALDHQSYKLEKLGYEGMGEMGIAGRRYFRKGGDNRTHQIHAFKTGDTNLIRHIAFRDYLIAHKDVAEAYGALKYEIAQRCNNDIGRYSDEKDGFVKHYEALALEWYREGR